MEGREGKEGMGWIFVVRPHAHAALSLFQSLCLFSLLLRHSSTLLSRTFFLFMLLLF